MKLEQGTHFKITILNKKTFSPLAKRSITFNYYTIRERFFWDFYGTLIFFKQEEMQENA